MTEYPPPSIPRPSMTRSVSAPPIPATAPKPKAVEAPSVSVQGDISNTLIWWPIRAFLIATGLILIQHLGMLLGRYLLAFKRQGTVVVQSGVLTLKSEWTLLGRTIRHSVTSAPLGKIQMVRFENRQRYFYLLVGIGCLVIGTLLGAQWFLNGLRAGYPYLMLLGAIWVLSGLAMDIGLYLFFPFRKKGSSHLIVQQSRVVTRLRGVDAAAASKVIDAIHREWRQDIG